MELENNIKENSPKVLPSWLCIILFLIGVSTMAGLLTLFVNIIVGPYLVVGWMRVHMMPDIINEFLMLVSVLFISFLLLRFGEDKRMSVLGMSGANRVGDFLMGFVTALLIMSIGFYTLLKLGQIKIVHIRFHPESFYCSLLFFTIVAITEEITIRGYILGRLLRAHLNKFIALALSAIIFSLMHVFNSSVSFLPLLNIFLAGLLLGSTYIYTHNLWYPISLHLFWNLLQGPVLGFEVSGNLNFLPMVKLKESAGSLLNGGSFGFEGSILCTFLLILFTTLILLIMENRQKNHSALNNI